MQQLWGNSSIHSVPLCNCSVQTDDFSMRTGDHLSRICSWPAAVSAAAGYWAQDWTRLEPHYGTEKDLKDMLAAAHRRGGSQY
jgi:hypothetical protein